MSWSIGGPEPKQSYCFPDKATAQSFADALGKGGKARISGRASIRKTPVTRVYGREAYKAKGFELAFTVYLQPFSFADTGEIARLARDSGSIPAPFDN